jgi:flagellar biosynthesis component FlhA
MSKKKKLARINNEASDKILEIKAILEALSDIEQSSYPANVLIEVVNKKLAKVFHNVEKNKEILKITD